MPQCLPAKANLQADTANATGLDREAVHLLPQQG